MYLAHAVAQYNGASAQLSSARYAIRQYAYGVQSLVQCGGTASHNGTGVGDEWGSNGGSGDGDAYGVGDE
jgi:hypothetical protein